MWDSTYRCHILTKPPLALGKLLVDSLTLPFLTHFFQWSEPLSVKRIKSQRITLFTKVQAKLYRIDPKHFPPSFGMTVGTSDDNESPFRLKA